MARSGTQPRFAGGEPEHSGGREAERAGWVTTGQGAARPGEEETKPLPQGFRSPPLTPPVSKGASCGCKGDRGLLQKQPGQQRTDGGMKVPTVLPGHRLAAHLTGLLPVWLPPRTLSGVPSPSAIPKCHPRVVS